MPSSESYDPESVGLVSDQYTTKKRAKKIPVFGAIKKRGKLLRNSKNLRFKEVYKPIEPMVLLSFAFVAGSIYLFLHYVVYADARK